MTRQECPLRWQVTMQVPQEQRAHKTTVQSTAAPDVAADAAQPDLAADVAQAELAAAGGAAKPRASRVTFLTST